MPTDFNFAYRVRKIVQIANTDAVRSLSAKHSYLYVGSTLTELRGTRLAQSHGGADRR